MPRSLLLMTALALIALSGCSRYPGGVSPSTVPLAPGGYTVIGRTEASDCKINLLGILPVSGGNQTYQAIESAKRRKNADALIDVSIDRVSKFFVLWTSVCTEVHATAVSIP